MDGLAQRGWKCHGCQCQIEDCFSRKRIRRSLAALFMAVANTSAAGAGYWPAMRENGCDGPKSLQAPLLGVSERRGELSVLPAGARHRFFQRTAKANGALSYASLPFRAVALPTPARACGPLMKSQAFLGG